MGYIEIKPEHCKKCGKDYTPIIHSNECPHSKIVTEQDGLLLTDEELENKLELISQASIGYDGRRLTKYRHKIDNYPFEWTSCYEPTPLEYAREVAQAQLAKDKEHFLPSIDIQKLQIKIVKREGREQVKTWLLNHMCHRGQSDRNYVCLGSEYIKQCQQWDGKP